MRHHWYRCARFIAKMVKHRMLLLVWRPLSKHLVVLLSVFNGRKSGLRGVSVFWLRRSFCVNSKPEILGGKLDILSLWIGGFWGRKVFRFDRSRTGGKSCGNWGTCISILDRGFHHGFFSLGLLSARLQIQDTNHSLAIFETSALIFFSLAEVRALTNFVSEIALLVPFNSIKIFQYLTPQWQLDFAVGI